MRTKRTLVLDDTDIKILEQLKHDGRMPFSTIARRVRVSENTARQRLYRLLNLGALQLTPKLNHEVLGREQARMLIRLIGPASSTALSELRRIPEITSIWETTGSADALAQLTVRSPAHLLDIVNEQIRLIVGIRSVEVLRHARTCKDRWTYSALAPEASPRPG